MPGRKAGGPKTGGRKKGSTNKTKSEIKDIAKEYAARAIERAAELIDAEDDRVSLQACTLILDRAYGKPTQAISSDPESPFKIIIGFEKSLEAKIARLANALPA